ncbi:MAG: bifunctional 4-hydroxy-2-oxoglutarate aldolase/2-dehydro-3-deoxy-phosphogluconate aldolase, partial [Sedimentisphaerales bacterium]|nr:bifunctional 4-hydroxy-2-oxoglutarate aldolase/2-dehydro-3-deoxy-phosphogluconate aldolase [Sedimentisphaerales bacterium]
MSRYKRLETLMLMKQIGVIPVFYHSDFETAKSVIIACADGGARVIEFTNRGDRAINVFIQLEEYCVKNKPEVILGVGAIVDAPTAAMYIAAGANFVVGPVLDEDTAKLCNGRKIPYSPGCGSATEIHRAEMLGVEICKVFPGAEVGGPNFVKMIKGPCPWTDIMPTGGVSPTKESLTTWFEAGVACVGMGSNLITKESLAAKDYAGITKRVRETL